MKKAALFISSILFANTLLGLDDTQKVDKVDQALLDLKAQIQQEQNGGDLQDMSQEQNWDKNLTQDQPNNQSGSSLDYQNQTQQQTPVVNEVQSVPTTGKPKKDYANMPVPNGAKLMTMRTEMTIPISRDRHTIIEFPFEIKSEFGEFEAMTTQKEAESLEMDKERQPISITQKENRLVINSSLSGKVEAIVWGGPYPVVVNIHITNNKNGVGYYVIREQDSFAKSGSNVKKIEANNHEKVISILTAAMFKEKKPKGYERRDIKKVYKYKDLGLSLVHVYSLEGDHYTGERWEVKNEDKQKSLNLYEEMFYMPNVYSVSFLANPIGPKKSTAMFIVKKREQKKQKKEND